LNKRNRGQPPEQFRMCYDARNYFLLNQLVIPACRALLQAATPSE